MFNGKPTTITATSSSLATAAARSLAIAGVVTSATSSGDANVPPASLSARPTRRVP